MSKKLLLIAACLSLLSGCGVGTMVKTFSNAVMTKDSVICDGIVVGKSTPEDVAVILDEKPVSIKKAGEKHIREYRSGRFRATVIFAGNVAESYSCDENAL